MLHGHGDDLHRYPGRQPVNFSSNIVNRPDHSALMARLAGVAALPSSYPEPDAAGLAARLGPTGTVVVTAGATEAIYLIALAHRGSRSAIVGPTFSEYEDACRLHGHTISHICSIRECGGADIVWLCNPNNPTGRVTPREEILAIAAQHPSTLFVIDQAYAPYTEQPVVSATEAVEAGNIMLLSSLTKRFSVPGLRIGYAVGAPALLEPISAVRMPWSVNAIAIEGASWLLDHQADYPVDAAALHAGALRMAAALRAMGVEVAPTDCNFILCRLPGERSAADLKEWLMEEENMLIRDASNFRSLTPSHFRVASQGVERDDMLINALSRWLKL